MQMHHRIAGARVVKGTVQRHFFGGRIAGNELPRRINQRQARRIKPTKAGARGRDQQAPIFKPDRDAASSDRQKPRACHRHGAD